MCFIAHAEKGPMQVVLVFKGGLRAMGIFESGGR